MPFHFVREMTNAHTAGKTDRPTTMKVAGPANAQPVVARRTPRRQPMRALAGRALLRAADGVAPANPNCMTGSLSAQGYGGLLCRLVQGRLRRRSALQHLGNRLADVAGQLRVGLDGRPGLLGVGQVVEELLRAGILLAVVLELRRARLGAAQRQVTVAQVPLEVDVLAGQPLQEGPRRT